MKRTRNNFTYLYSQIRKADHWREDGQHSEDVNAMQATFSALLHMYGIKRFLAAVAYELDGNAQWKEDGHAATVIAGLARRYPMMESPYEKAYREQQSKGKHRK